MKLQRRMRAGTVALALTAAIAGASVTFAQGLLARRGPGSPPATAPTTNPDSENSGKPDEPGMPPMPGGMMDQAAAAGMQVYVDDSFASVDKLRSAIRLQHNQQARDAITAYQAIIQDYGQKLVYLNDKSYVSITDYVRDRLLEMPAVKTGMYDQLYGAEARKAIDAAIDDRDISALMRVSDRYYPSAAALKGLTQAAEWYFERGEFSAAAETWRKLLKHPLAGSIQADLLFRAATAQSLAGATDQAKALRDHLAKDFSDATGTVSGKDVNLLERLDSIMAMPAWDKITVGGDEWPAFGGGPSRTTLLNSNAAIGAKLWTVPLNNAPDSGAASSINSIDEIAIRGGGGVIRLAGGGIIMANTGALSSVQGDPTMLPSQPVLSNGSLFIHMGNQLISVSANAGTRLWTFPPAPSVSGDVVVRTVNGARSAGHNSAAVFGDQVFAMLPVTSTVSMQYDATGTPAFPTRIVCLSRDDGHEIWSRPATEVKTEKDGTLNFTGSPVVTRQGVFIMARKGANNGNGFVQQYLVRLDRENGQPTWACYLCSTNIANQSGNMSIPVPALVDDVLYICTGQGADCAVDANVGRILWLRIAPKRTSSSAYTPPWKYNPPLVVGDKLLVSDAGRALRVYNRWNGKLIHEYTPADLLGPTPGSASIDVLAGVVGTKVIMSLGSYGVCFDESELEKDNPEPAWREMVSSENGKPMGRPFLTQTGYYVPFEKSVVRFDIKSGLSTPVPWPNDDKEQPGKPGNLLVTSEQVVVVNDSEVAGYAKWETARDIRQAKIDANPKDPAPRLALAEVAFRTSNAKIARDNMKTAVELANAGNAPPGQSVTDILERLYRTNLVFAEQLLAKRDNELRDSSRFYFEQCQAAARTPEQQAEWRLRLAELSQRQKKPDEAVSLYSEVLADPAVRIAGYREGDVLQSAGATAEQRIRLLKDKDAEVYKRYEDKAAALTQRGTAGGDTATLQQVIDAFPNSAASIRAGTTLAAMYINKQEWESARRVLFWLQPRVKEDAQAHAFADLAKVNIGLKKFTTAAAWAARGQRQFKDFSWTDGKEKMTFASLRTQISKDGGSGLEGRFPAWNGDPAHPVLDYVIKEAGSTVLSLRDQHAAAIEGADQLLAPVETALALRSPNLLFLRRGNVLKIFDTNKDEYIADQIRLPRTADTVLLGVTGDTAVLLQSDAVIGVNVKTKEMWTKDLPQIGSPPRGAGSSGTTGPTRRIPSGSQVEQIGDILYVNGSPYAQAGQFTLVDDNGIPFLGRAGNDPESARRAAFAPLGNLVRFTTANIFNGKVYILAGSQVDAFNIADGKPAWVSRDGRKLPQTLPTGNALFLTGNEDLVVVQVDSTDGKSSTFCAFDGETGKQGRQFKLDAEHANWRALGDDGMLYVVTTSSVAAYDMMSEAGGAAWRRTGLGSHFAAATALSLDGLVVVTDNNEVQCLSLESGDTHWTGTMPQSLLSGSNPAATMHSMVIAPELDPRRDRLIRGDLVVFQSADGCAAFQTTKVIDGKADNPNPQLVWQVTPMTNPPLPPRQSLQFFDKIVVEQMAGAVKGVSTRQVEFGARDLQGGNMRFNLPLAEGDSPLRSWQVLDNGIAVDVGPTTPGAVGRIYFIKNKKP